MGLSCGPACWGSERGREARGARGGATHLIGMIVMKSVVPLCSTKRRRGRGRRRRIRRRSGKWGAGGVGSGGEQEQEQEQEQEKKEQQQVAGQHEVHR